MNDDAVVVDETEDAEDINLNILCIYLIKIYRNFLIIANKKPCYIKKFNILLYSQSTI